eukprot:TRINITY_DN1676_c0_g1_i3.p1 TRINITY_DN1676_c0_g1~~TRINITY_DN1676_c0_g1_i3.p1  ORF type:complete len:179 (+),score=36.01 TRINITY_DN1676_c0_g1_i3:22-558(+)
MTTQARTVRRNDTQTTQKSNDASKSVAKRLQSELMQLMVNNSSDLTAFPDGDNLFKWAATVKGVTGTVYEGLTYKLSIEFPPNYPYKAPEVKFENPCFHPNVDTAGNICLDILKDKWSPVYNVRTLLLSIQSLLGEPNNDSPLNPQAAALWSDQEQFKKILISKYQEIPTTTKTERKQ